MSKIIVDLTGKRFGRLIVLKKHHEKKGVFIQWECICDCGNSKIAVGKTLKNGGTKSCGCLFVESSISNLPDNKKEIGFERLTSKGYVEIKTENGFKRKHVFVMEKSLGRELVGDEVVHHIDENRLNNDISNLELMSHGDHTRLHHLGKKESNLSRRNISEGKLNLSKTKNLILENRI